jgi:hypothetical protein
MSRIRLVLAVTCLGVFFLAAAPGAASASIDPARESADVFRGSFVRITAWSYGLLDWMHSIVAPEHGQIVPGANPPAPPPAPEPGETTPPSDEEGGETPRDPNP